MNRFLALSDIHESQRRMEKIIGKVSPVYGIIIVGDFTRRGGYREAEAIVKRLLVVSERIFAVHGNMDDENVLRFLVERGYSLHGGGAFALGIGFFGTGGSNPTPFRTPSEYSEDQIACFLAQGYQAVRETTRKILVSHTPPADTRLDRLRFGAHGGSKAVRQFLLEHPVDLCLCGHIHEAAGEETVGTTRCVNIGAVKDGSYAYIDIDEKNITVTRRTIS